MILKIILLFILVTVFVTIGFLGFMFLFEKVLDVEDEHPLMGLILTFLSLVVLLGGIIAPLYIGEKLKLRDKLRCPKCEEVIEVEDKFCSNCGYKLMEDNSIEDNHIYK